MSIVVLGLITEYNPFHNGHLYHLKKAKEITNSDASVVIMSGSFTQQGNIAIYDKFTRAKVAVENGADLVLELPTIYSNSSANYFAFGAINLLNKLNIINHICFGCECNDITKLNEISDILLKYNSEINDNIPIISKEGSSYAISREKILSNYLNLEQISILRKPNNILGIEYLNNLKKLNSKIIPHSITRVNSDFNDKNLSQKTYTSGSSIRKFIEDNLGNVPSNISTLKGYVPDNMYNIMINNKPLFNEDLYNIIKYKLISVNKNYIKDIFEVNEGLENKIIKEINNSTSYEQFINNIKSKRYQLSKIKRAIINILLGISKDDFNFAYENEIAYAHVLACNQTGKNLLSYISKNSNIEIITSINNDILKNISINTSRFLNYDIYASNIHSILSNTSINKDYTNRL